MTEKKEANAIVEMTAEKIANVTGFTPVRNGGYGRFEVLEAE